MKTPAKRPGRGKPSSSGGAAPSGSAADIAPAGRPRPKRAPAIRTDEPKPPAAKSPAKTKAPVAKPSAGKPAVGKPSTPKKAATKAVPVKAVAGPAGFGGWLWLLVIGQLLVTARMIDTLAKMAALVGTEVWQDHPGLVATDLALYGAAFVLQLAVLAAMALRKASFVPLFIAAIVAYFLIGRVEPLLAIAFLGMDPVGLGTQAVLLPMAIELAVGLVWGAYVLRSRRVKNTFVR